jgi:hypothetical protein
MGITECVDKLNNNSKRGGGAKKYLVFDKKKAGISGFGITKCK